MNDSEDRKKAVSDLLEVGDRVPELSVLDEDGRELSISDFRGKWVVLYFYPRDNTPGCTREAMDFSRLSGRFEKLGAVVLGTSPDSVDSHTRFRERRQLEISLLSDPGGSLIEACGASRRSVSGGRRPSVRRSTLLIDPNGTVAAAWRKVRVSGHAEEVLDRLEHLISLADA